MKNKAKKLVAALLTVLMLLSIAPMGMLEGTDLAEAFGTAADAAGLNRYCATAAAEWAKAHWNDYTSLLFGKGYFEIRQPEKWGGDCANFVSQCLYMGGIDMDSYGSWGWIRLNEFTYQRHIDSPSVDHDRGGWKTVQVANCRQDGIDIRTCRRCGVTQDKTTKVGHICRGIEV